MSIKTYYRQRRVILLISISMIIVLALVVANPLLPTYHNLFTLVQLKNWLNNNQLACLVWRLGLLLILFLSWPAMIRYKAKIRRWPLQNIQRAINLRYGLVVFLLLLDVLFQWGQV